MAGKSKASPKSQEIYAPADVRIPRRFGGGVLKERVIRELPSKRIIQYALAYINPLIFSGDNGRVLGYRFDAEWKEIAMAFVNGCEK